MVEHFHLLEAVFEHARSATMTFNYDECWELADLLWQEWQFHFPASSGELLSTTCIEQPQISASPMPELHP